MELKISLYVHNVDKKLMELHSSAIDSFLSMFSTGAAVLEATGEIVCSLMQKLAKGTVPDICSIKLICLRAHCYCSSYDRWANESRNQANCRRLQARSTKLRQMRTPGALLETMGASTSPY